MKNNYLFLISCFLMLTITSCDKVKRTKKKMSGEWEVVNYRFQNHSGLIYEYVSDGYFQFENCSEDNCLYSINFTYNDNGIEMAKKENGTYSIQSDGEMYRLNRLNQDGTITELDKCRNIVLTKDELKTQLQDEAGIHYFILEKR